MNISIAHMYPKLLNLYGDIGNIITLKKRCEWRGIEVELDDIGIGDLNKPHDIYFIGGGQDKQQEDVAEEMYRNKEFLISERDRGAVFLGICGGYQLFGHYYQPNNREKLKGISLLDAYTVAGKKRFIGNVTAESDWAGSLVGFENHSGLTYIDGDTHPLAKVVVGNGNNGRDGTEGARFKNVFGTYLHGSLLPKNPKFTDYLIKLTLETKYGKETELTPLEDEFENKAHEVLIGKAY